MDYFETVKTPTEAEVIMYEIYLYTQQINGLRKHYTGDRLTEEISKVIKKIEDCETKLNNL